MKALAIAFLLATFFATATLSRSADDDVTPQPGSIIASLKASSVNNLIIMVSLVAPMQLAGVTLDLGMRSWNWWGLININSITIVDANSEGPNGLKFINDESDTLELVI